MVTIEQIVIATIINCMHLPAEKVVREARFDEDLGADSLERVEMTMRIEDALGIEIPDKDADKLATVGNLLDYCTKHAKIGQVA